jgi:hypothetical protein
VTLRRKRTGDTGTRVSGGDVALAQPPQRLLDVHVRVGERLTVEARPRASRVGERGVGAGEPCEVEVARPDLSLGPNRLALQVRDSRGRCRSCTHPDDLAVVAEEHGPFLSGWRADWRAA